MEKHQHPNYVAEIILDQHVSIRRTMGKIRGLLDHDASPDGFPEQIKNIQLLSDLLREQLTHHFQIEEQHGMLHDIERKLPQYKHNIKAIFEEHKTLLSQFAHYHTEVNELTTDRQVGLSSIRATFGEFAEAINRHEDRENNAVLDAYNIDIGALD